MKFRRKSAGPKADINITPFIDILLVLLVIFMTITPLTPKGLPAQVPQPPPPGAPPPKPDDTLIVVTIDKAGVIKVNQDVTDIKELGPKLQGIFATRNERVMFVNAHPELLYKDVVDVIDVGKGAGVDKIGIMTEQITGAPK